MERTALITGASRGIGRAVAEHFQNSGIRVLAPSRAELDLLSDLSVSRFLTALGEPVDILVNNAGINPLAGCTDLDDADIERTLQVNVISPLRLIRGIAPSMMERKYGRILNISSIWSRVSKPGRLIYSASKSAINGMTRSLSVELAGYNILVNAIAPGYVNTELTRVNNTEAELKRIAAAIPLQRLAEPEEIAEAAGFLCSDKNTYITGQTIFVDGGYTCL